MRQSAFLAAALIAFTALPGARAQNANAKTHVFLVACSAYDSPKHFSTLPYTVKEMEEFRDLLVETGIDAKHVKMLSNKFKRDSDNPNEKRYSPTRDNILNELKIVLNKLDEDSTLIAAFSMHGMQPQGAKTAFICPIDGKVDDPKTLIPTEGEDGLYSMLKSAKGARKLLIVNACRDDPNNRATMAANTGNFDKKYKHQLPKGIAGIFSCQPGEFSYFYKDEGDTKGRRRSLFFHHLIEAWRGTYSDGKPVTLEDVFTQVKQRTADDADQVFGDSQVPDVRREYARDWLIRDKASRPPKKDIAKVEPKFDPKPEASPRKGGDIAEVEIAKGVKMKFCWIPPGKATLGDPNESANKEHEFTSKGFWMGKYTVTQEEWEAVMGKNPSYFSKEGGGKDKVAGQDTSRFPVEMVSWDDCQDFLEKVNRTSKLPATMGKGKFALPHEDEWEYACRGGLGNKRKFYWGDVLNGDKANCNGNYPDGTETKGPYLGRTAAVGSYEQKAPHPWGLCDMSGNVWQWCSNWYNSEQKHRVLRGGSWGYVAGDCRAAFRIHGGAPGGRSFSLGFRVVLLLP